jgi:hypothetical protein
MLGIWSGLALIGLVGSWFLTPEILPSGMFFLWVVVSILPLILTWVILFPLNLSVSQLIIPMWHLFFALAYYVTGYYVDKRWWWLASWETVLVVAALLLNYNVIRVGEIKLGGGLTFGLTSGIPLLIAALPVWSERYGTYRQRSGNRTSST